MTELGLPIGAVDALLAAVLLLSMAVGAWRGFVFELLSLVGWVAAWFVARMYAGDIAPRVPIGAAGSGLNYAASFVLIFVGVLVAWAIGARLLRVVLYATPLSGIDRLFGLVFGALRGVVVLLAVAYVVALTPAATAPAWKESLGAQWLNAVLRAAAPLWPGGARGVPA